MNNKISLATTLSLAAALYGCQSLGLGTSGTHAMAASPNQPAAEGSVRFAEAKNGNTSVDIKVKHLASPEKLTPSESTYIVWVQRDDKSAPQNMGALQVDKRLNGTLSTITPLKRFELFITAEHTSQVERPTGSKQLWTSFSR